MDTETALATIRSFQEYPPVDVVAIAKMLGLNVYVDDMPNNISGKLNKDTKYGGTSGYVIIVNSKHSSTRQRFTAAHEIAHFILHRNSIGDGISESVMYRAEGLSNYQETEANRLAADILMLWHLLSQATATNINLDALAEKFNVSPVAMSIRLGIPT